MAKYRVLDPVLIGDRMWGVGDDVEIADAGHAAYMTSMKKIAPWDSPQARLEMHGHPEMGTGEQTLAELLDKDPNDIVVATSAVREMTPVDRTTSKPGDPNPPGAGTMSAGADDTINPNKSGSVVEKPGKGVDDQHPVNPANLGKPVDGPGPKIGLDGKPTPRGETTLPGDFTKGLDKKSPFEPDRAPKK